MDTKYPLTADANGGAIPTTTGWTGTIPTTTKAGYTFKGWYTAASGGTQVIDASGVVQASVSGWTNANNYKLLSWTILN